MGSRALWKAFGQIIARRFGERAAFAATINAGDPISPVAELLTLGLAALTIYQIYRAWDDIWGKVEQELGNPNSEIVVTQEPQNQVYTTPNGEQQTIEHTGSAPPQVETGTQATDTEQQVEVPNHTGNSEREQQTAQDFVMEAKKEPIDFSVTSGGTTLTTGRNFKDHFLRHKKLLEDFYDTKYSKLRVDGSRFLEDVAKLIDSGVVQYVGQGTLGKDAPISNIYRGNGLTVVVKLDG